MNIEFWKNKRILLTGHTGFKGSWLSLWLQMLGADVCGYALEPNTQPNLFELADVAKGMKHIIGDIRDNTFLQKKISEFQPEIIIHMAAQPLVRYSYENPVETYAVNVMGTVNLLEAARSCQQLKVILNVTSDKCYENKEWIWSYRETDPMGGYDPYSCSKGCAELITASYKKSFYDSRNVAIATARAGNVIGGGDWSKDRLIPDIIQSFIKSKNVIIRNPHATRPWQFVLEPLAGYLQLIEKCWDHPENFSEGWNFGPNEHDVKAVSWITDKIIELLNSTEGWTLDPKAQPHEAKLLKLDNTKAKNQLNWHPKWNLETALSETIKLYQAYYSKQDVRAIAISQIDNYINS